MTTLRNTSAGTMASQRILHAVVLSILALLLVACGGGGGDGDATTSEAQPASTTFDANGGTLRAALQGGSTVVLEVPAGALPAGTTVRIDPDTAAADELGRFKLTLPASAITGHLTLRITPTGPFDADTMLVLLPSAGGQPRPLASDVDTTTGTLSVALGAPQRRFPASAPSGQRARAQSFQLPPTEASGFYLFAVKKFTYDRLLSVLDAAVADLLAAGSDDNADNVFAVMDAVLKDSRRPPATELRVIQAGMKWAAVVCPQQEFALSAFKSFNGVDIQTYRARVLDVFLWGQNARDVNHQMAAMVSPQPTACTKAPPSDDAIADPVRQGLPTFLANVKSQMDLLDPADPGSFDTLFGARYKDMLKLARDFALFDLTELQQQTLTMLGVELDRVRDAAWNNCRQQRSQILQAKLVQLVVTDPLINPLAPENREAELYEDAQYCGMAIHWQALDSNGNVLAQGDAGGLKAGSVLATANVPAAGLATLRIDAPLLTLFCPDNLPNAEQLLFDALPASGTGVNLKTMTPFNVSLYQITGPVDFSADQILQTGTVLRMRRSGDTCHGLFLNMGTPSKLVDFRIDFGTPQITTASLPGGTVGSAYAVTLQASGGKPPYSWGAGGLPAGLSLDPTTGTISGTPTTAGSSTAEVVVIDDVGSSSNHSFSLTINPKPAVAGTYAGTFTNVEGQTSQITMLVETDADRVLIRRFSNGVPALEGLVCRLGADGALTYLGQGTFTSIHIPPANGEVFVGAFSGNTLTMSDVSGPDSLTWSLTKQ